MTLLPRGLKVHLALGYTDMRKGIDGLTMLVQAVLRQDPFSGQIDQMLTEARVILPGSQALLGFQLAIVLTQALLDKFGGDALSEVKRNVTGYLAQVRARTG